MAVAVAACAEPVEPPVATELALSETSLRLTALTETRQLTASVRDQRGKAMDGATVSWESSDLTVATVSATGMVEAIRNGTATIRAASSGITASATVTVEQVGTTIRLSADSLNVPALRDTIALTGSVLDAKGRAITSASIAWTSSDTMIVTVSASGLLTARANGRAIVTAQSGGLSAAAVVRVSQIGTTLRMLADSVRLTALGDTASVAAVVLDARGQAITDAPITWQSSDAAIVTVSANGVATAVANGAASVTARHAQLSGVTTVRVKQTAALILLSRRTHTFGVIGDTVRLTATVRDARGTPIANASPAWSSAKPSVASVSADGLVRAFDYGLTDVAAALDGASTVAAIRVDSALRLVVKQETVHQFIDETQMPGYDYAGVSYPPSPISYVAQGFTVFDLWEDGRPDIFAPLLKGYGSGLDTRMKPLLFRNRDGVFAESSGEVSIPSIAGVRRVASVGLPADPLRGLFGIQHDTHDGRMADALMLAGGAAPTNATHLIAPLPLASAYGRNTAVNAHSMGAGDLDGDGRTDFVVGDWGDQQRCAACSPYFLMQQPDGRWNVRADSVLFDITFKQPMVNAGAGEGVNLLIDLHLADLTGDGLADLIAGYGHGSTAGRVYINQGGARFTTASSYALPTPPFGVDNSMHVKTFSLDLNRDGARDLVVIYTRFQPYYGGYAFQILINDGTGKLRDETFARLRSLAEREVVNQRLTWSDNFHFVDVNGDSHVDFIGSHTGTNPHAGLVRLWLNDGAGNLNEVPVETGDVFRDGAMPLGWADFGSGRMGTLAFRTSWTDAQGSATRVWFTHYEFNRVIR